MNISKQEVREVEVADPETSEGGGARNVKY